METAGSRYGLLGGSYGGAAPKLLFIDQLNDRQLLKELSVPCDCLPKAAVIGMTKSSNH